MSAARISPMPGPFFFDGPDGPSLTQDHRRLCTCVGLSAVLFAIAISTVDISFRLDFSRLLPKILHVTLRDAAEPEPIPVAASTAEPADAAPPAAETRPVAEQPTRESPAATRAPTTDAPAAAAAASATPVDWYAALERAAAATVDESRETDSLHPEFDALRRLAAERYGPSQAKESPPPWGTVEEDIYGRTLLRRGNCFQVLDDPNVGNRYAFETFERYLWQCTYAFGGRPGRNLPWVGTIRAKYNHLRDPDGSLSAADRRVVKSDD